MAKRLPEIRLNEEKHVICSTSVAAAQFGISRVGMDKSIKELGIAKENARVDLAEIIDKRFNKANAAAEAVSDSARKLKAEADYKAQKAKQEEMVTLQMMGELIPQEEVKDALENEFLDIRQKLLLLPETIKSKVYSIDAALAVTCGEVANEVVQELLRKLAGINGKSEDAGKVGKKPKRNYKKGAKSISAAASGNGE